LGEGEAGFFVRRQVGQGQQRRQANLRVNQLLKLGRGAVVELEQRTSDPVEIFANDVLIAKGEVVITSGDKIGVTLTELVKSIYSAGAK
jgi:flagellar motor switch protein FliN/FliY